MIIAARGHHEIETPSLRQRFLDGGFGFLQRGFGDGQRVLLPIAVVEQLDGEHAAKADVA